MILPRHKRGGGFGDGHLIRGTAVGQADAVSAGALAVGAEEFLRATGRSPPPQQPASQQQQAEPQPNQSTRTHKIFSFTTAKTNSTNPSATLFLSIVSNRPALHPPTRTQDYSGGG